MTRPSPYQGWTYWTRTKPFCCHWKLSSVTSDLSVAPPCPVGLVSPLSLTNPPHGMAVGPHFSIVCSGLSRDTPGYVSLVMGEGIHHPFLLVPLTPYYIVIVSVPICLLPIWVLPLDKNQSDSAVCGHSCLKVSNQWLMRAGSSQEAKALCSMNFRNPPPWRQGIHQSVCQRVQTSKWPGDQLMWIIIHPGEGRSDSEEKEFHFVPFQQNCLPQTCLWKHPPNLALEHLSMLVGKRKDDLSLFLSHRTFGK